MFAGGCAGWSLYAGVTAFASATVTGGGAGGRWIPRRKPKLMDADDVRMLLARETGILVQEEDEDVAVLQLLGLL